MKVKTSITLSEDLLREIERYAVSHRSRSEFIEAAITAYLEARKRQERDRKDLEILNTHADRLNKEAEDVLSYQVTL